MRPVADKVTGAGLWASAGALVLLGFALVHKHQSLTRELSIALAEERIHIEKVTAIRRGARSTYVVLLEWWLSPASERATHQPLIEQATATVRREAREFAALPPLSAAEATASERFRSAVAIWSNRMEQALVAADGPAPVGELRDCVHQIDISSDRVLAIDSSAGSTSDDRMVSLNRTQSAIEVAAVPVVAAMLSLVVLWWRSKMRAERRFAESEKARADDERSAEQRAMFFTNMSHELRTPLIAIRGFATTITERADGDPEIADAARSIDREGKELIDVLNNILDAAKLEAGKVKLALENVRLEPIVERCMRRCHALVGAKPIALDARIPANLPEVRADVVKLQQILTNLVANAIKFTEEGTVTVSARTTTKQVIIHVTDTGIGIRESAIARVWNPFEQETGTTARRFGGTGLGLAIVRALVELHQGEVLIKSTVGKGTRVSVALPRSAPSDRLSVPPRSSVSPGAPA